MRNTFLLIFLALALAACKKDEPSGDTNITNFSVTDISRPSFTIDQIFQDDSSKIIYLCFSDRMPADSFPLQLTASFTLPDGATSNPVSGEVITSHNIDERLKYTISAGDGTQVEYFVVLRDSQLPNSGFEDWYTAVGMDGNPLSEPGISAETTVWGTPNYATSIYGMYCTKPLVNGDNTVVQIITVATTVPITAGTIFTGKFDMNGAINHPTDPSQSAILGIPFSLRPDSFKFRYTYQPGSHYIKATLIDPDNIFGGFTVTDIAGTDMYNAYAILEKRTGTDVVEVGRAEISSDAVQVDLKEISLPFVYSSNQKPTHISVVFSSSKDGNFFTGAVGSTLTVDDVELVY
jgi:hypothetical protein